MPQPLIILGAGASYDLIPPNSRRGDVPVIPMTDFLLRGQYRDEKIAGQFNELTPLFSKIAPFLENNKRSFEECLVRVSDKQQLVALRFYLSEYFFDRSYRVRGHGTNNYAALIDYISESGGAHVINFNYDTTFDHRLSVTLDEGLSHIDKYVSGDIKLFKVHGCSDWFYIARKEHFPYDPMTTDSYSFSKLEPNYRADSIYTRTELTGKPDKFKEFYHVPLLIPPISGKNDFVCPASHVESLKTFLASAQKILIIGWRAQDPGLLSLLRESIQRPIEVIIVSGGKEQGNEVAKNLSRNVPDFKITNTELGFTDFLASEWCESFFKV